LLHAVSSPKGWRLSGSLRDIGERPFVTDSVEKLISQAHGILQANSEVAENPHETRGMAHCAQLWSEIVGNRSPLGSLEFQPF
jgi:hypothetical protein